MTITEEKMNLFESGIHGIFAHCISADFALGAGIAKEFAKRHVKENLNALYNDFAWVNHGIALYTYMPETYGVYNLVTKEHYYDKPTYKSLKEALISMREQISYSSLYICSNEPIKIVMPKIGCGLDKLEWSKVKSIISEVFNDMDVDIIICYI
jgi:hypothetical protein